MASKATPLLSPSASTELRTRLRVFGTKPLLGRTFAPEEEVMGAPPVAVISHEFFMSRFAGDRSALGKTVSIDSIPTTIIGVMPRGFAYPNFAGAPNWLPPTFWQPIALFQAKNQALTLRGLHVDSRTVMRLRQGVDSTRANAAMRTIQLRLAADVEGDERANGGAGFQGAVRSVVDFHADAGVRRLERPGDRAELGSEFFVRQTGNEGGVNFREVAVGGVE